MGERVRFLSVADVLCIHADTIVHEGGLAGLRDEAMLSAAVMMPQAMFGGRFLHVGIAPMAGAYWFHISQAHAFNDGNKRTALMAAPFGGFMPCPVYFCVFFHAQSFKKV